ncbi:hypothetical protein BPA30113_03374 [Burkholderia paludis]|uniref:Uncharacterized protein n=1 Tax=Burkholderia paludis TaxID=1506587 RepID=A0A6P2M691_9BURK|nr:hypothetical protein LMG30113_03280 [Burkholderia paludis]VWB74388.1 hypothetical protein BPA30113_03374 [Burkholderia paludis]
MLSCRDLKGPLIFVPVLMHRETNLQVENEETIEAQSARTPKRCWTESNSAFSFLCTDFHPWCIDLRRFRVPRLRSHRAFAAPFPRIVAPPVFPLSYPPATACTRAPAVRAYPVGGSETPPLHLAFADRAVGKIGRQFSWKQNAEEGVRLDETRRAMDQGRKGGWRRSFVVGWAHGPRGFPGPSCGPYARPGVLAGRCVRTRIGNRGRMCGRMSHRPADPVPLAVRVAPGRIGGHADHRCARIDCSRAPAFLRFLHPDDTAAAHRGGRTTVSAGRSRARAGCRPGPVTDAACHGKTSVGVARRDS